MKAIDLSTRGIRFRDLSDSAIPALAGSNNNGAAVPTIQASLIDRILTEDDRDAILYRVPFQDATCVTSFHNTADDSAKREKYTKSLIIDEAASRNEQDDKI